MLCYAIWVSALVGVRTSGYRVGVTHEYSYNLLTPTTRRCSQTALVGVRTPAHAARRAGDTTPMGRRSTLTVRALCEPRPAIHGHRGGRRSVRPTSHFTLRCSHPRRCTRSTVCRMRYPLLATRTSVRYGCYSCTCGNNMATRSQRLTTILRKEANPSRTASRARRASCAPCAGAAMPGPPPGRGELGTAVRASTCSDCDVIMHRTEACSTRSRPLKWAHAPSASARPEGRSAR